MMRAAVIVNPATTDVPALRETVEKTLAAAGTLPRPLGPGRALPDRARQMDGEVIDDGRSLNAQIEPGALVVRAPHPVRLPLTRVRSLR
jgi:hypothetical protein